MLFISKFFYIFAKQDSLSWIEFIIQRKKFMKKLFFSALVLAAGVFTAQAQSLRVEAGATFANQKVVDKTQNIKIGARAGVGAEFSLAPMVYLGAGLNYQMGGFKTAKVLEAAQVSTTLHYLTLPVTIGFRAPLTSDLSVSVEGGPYAAFGLSGKASATAGKLKVDVPTEVFGDNGALKRFDAGLNVSAAVEYQRFYFRLGTEIGMLDVSKFEAKNSSVKNMNFFTTVGFRF